MSMSTGGRADKLGNRYEGFWVAYQLLKLLAEEIAAVQLEAIGDDEDGVDVWVTHRDGTRDAQQCKRKNRTRGKWSIGELTRQEVLKYLANQLMRNPTARFTLVSAHPAPEFRGLCDTARTAGGDPEEYFRETLVVKDHADNLRKFCSAVSADTCTPDGRRLAFDLLRRSFAHLHEDSPEGRGIVMILARCLIDGDSNNAVEVLANFAQDRLGEVLTVEQVRCHLRDRGFTPTNLAGNPQAIAQVERLRQEFHESLRPSLIHSSLVPRPEAAIVFDLLNNLTNQRLVVLHGRSGTGKSCVLLQLTELLDQKGIPYLPLRLDRRTPKTSSRRYGIEVCDLPESPAVVLHSLNAGHRSVLILDQLDAVRWTAAHASASWEACRQLIDDALAFPKVAVVVACRTFDLRDDQQIKAWHQSRQGQEVAVGDLQDDAVSCVVAASGGNYSELSPRQKVLLRSPLHLALWTQIVLAGRTDIGWNTQMDLLRAFWRCQFDAAVKMGVPINEIRDAVSALINEMDRRGEPSVPARILDAYKTAADALRSLHVIVVTKRQLTFAHQSYFEYQLATQLVDEALKGGQSVLVWIQRGDQSLLRREQLRLVLMLLRDENHFEYLSTVRGLISAPNGAVRFHLRQLVLRQLGEVIGPTSQECDLACELVELPVWREHTLDQVFLRQPAWMDAADDQGLVARWLAAEDESLVNLARFICSIWSAQRGDRVARLIEPYQERPDPWRTRIAATLPFNPADDTSNLFLIRLALIRRGAMRHKFLSAKDLAERTPERLIDHLQAYLDHRRIFAGQVTDTPADERRFPYYIPLHEVEHLKQVAESLPIVFWERLMPYVVETCERTRMEDNERNSIFFFRDSTWALDGQYFREHDVALPQIVARAGSKVVSNDPAGFASRHDDWLNHPGQSVQYTVGLALAESTETAANLAIEWLCDNPHRFSLPDEREDHWGIAKRIIRRHASVCSSETYSRLEQTLLQYYEPEERRSVRLKLEFFRAGWPLQANDYGLSQHALLPCLPDFRLSETARSKIGELERKFDKTAGERDIDRRGRIRSIVGPIGRDRANRISDRGWLRIISNTNRAISHRIIDADTVADTSAEGFARSLGDQAPFDPGRFARLALAISSESSPNYLPEIFHALALSAPPNTECTGWNPATDIDVRSVIEHFGYQENNRIASSMCWLMLKRHKSLNSQRCHELLCLYATLHPDPEPDWRIHSASQKFEDIAINCVRGAAIGAIGQMLFTEPNLLAYFETTLRRVASDPHPAVRVAVVGACLPILKVKRDIAVELFLTACTGPDEMLSAGCVSKFIRYSLSSHCSHLDRLIHRMAESDVPDVSTTGAAWLTVASLYGQIRESEIEILLRGNAHQRKGVARAAAHNCDDGTVVVRCTDLLSGLISDPDEKVSDQASEFLRKTVILRSPDGRRLAEMFAGSSSFDRHPFLLIEALSCQSDSLIPLAPIIKSICVRVAKNLNNPNCRERFQSGFDLDRFSPLILRLYEQAEQVGDISLRTECIDCWDQLLEARLGGAAKILSELEVSSGIVL